MPVYDYRCSLCGRQVEVMHAIEAPGPGTCEACGGPMRKALSPPAIHFKGSGWAKKDAALSTTKGSPAGSAGAGSRPTTGSGETAARGAERTPEQGSGSADTAVTSSRGAAGGTE